VHSGRFAAVESGGVLCRNRRAGAAQAAQAAQWAQWTRDHATQVPARLNGAAALPKLAA